MAFVYEKLNEEDKEFFKSFGLRDPLSKFSPAKVPIEWVADRENNIFFVCLGGLGYRFDKEFPPTWFYLIWNNKLVKIQVYDKLTGNWNTGINAVIKVSHMRPEKNPCILVETKAGRVSITIEDEPIANESCRLDNTTLSCLRKWIVLNKDILLAYWNDDLYPTSQLLHQIKKLS